jgi:hypothetical protein
VLALDFKMACSSLIGIGLLITFEVCLVIASASICRDAG